MTATYATSTELIGFLGFTSSTNPFTTTQLQDALNRAEEEINDRVNTKFVTGTDATPPWGVKTAEKHTGKGCNQLNYSLDQYPLPDVSTTISAGSAVTADDTIIWVASTNGFPESGYILVEDDKIQYTDKTTDSFTGCTSVAAHGTSKTVTPHIIEINTSDVGQKPNWAVLEQDKDFDLDLNSGRVQLYESSLDLSNSTSISRFPSYQIANRLRATYINGWDTIPKDITRLTLMIAAKDLLHTVVRKAHSIGKDGFEPSMIDVDEDWINNTIDRYKSYKCTSI